MYYIVRYARDIVKLFGNITENFINISYELANERNLNNCEFIVIPLEFNNISL